MTGSNRLAASHGTAARLPARYASSHPTEDPISFAEAIRELPQTIETGIAYRNRYAADWIETDRFNAIVEPVRLFEAAAGEPDGDPLFHVPTSTYSIIDRALARDPSRTRR